MPVTSAIIRPTHNRKAHAQQNLLELTHGLGGFTTTGLKGVCRRRPGEQGLRGFPPLEGPEEVTGEKNRGSGGARLLSGVRSRSALGEVVMQSEERGGGLVPAQDARLGALRLRTAMCLLAALACGGAFLDSSGCGAIGVGAPCNGWSGRGPRR